MMPAALSRSRDSDAVPRLGGGSVCSAAATGIAASCSAAVRLGRPSRTRLQAAHTCKLSKARAYIVGNAARWPGERQTDLCPRAATL